MNLNPLVNSSIGKKVASNTQLFWSSKSAIMKILKDDLFKLMTDVPEITAVYPNRKVKVAPIAKAKDEPFVVKDNKTHTWGIEKTGALATWGLFQARGAGVKVAVLDTGVDANHPDLKGKIADFAEFDYSGKVIKSGVQHAYDSDQHGTHCAGIIAGGQCKRQIHRHGARCQNTGWVGSKKWQWH